MSLPSFNLFCFLLCCLLRTGHLDFISDLNLPKAHLPYLLKSNKYLAEICSNDRKCKSHYLQGNTDLCWGYEDGCEFRNSYSSDKASCTTPSVWGPDDPEKQLEAFLTQGDFRKLKETIESIRPICTSSKQDGSFLECSSHLRFCRAKNIFFDFKSLRAKTSKRYRDDVIHDGEVGGKCDVLNRDLLLSRADEKSYLQSWGHELQHFNSSSTFRVDHAHCDVIFERPTFIIKLDASVNMYHHFCDFVNLYASQHINGSFDRDVDILWWDTFPAGFVDPTFGITWKAFSKRTPKELIGFDGRKVCFKNAVFPMLARQRFGLYYNMPLVDGCQGSGLFSAFSEHILHRLGIKQMGPILNSVRVTLLTRSTKFRRIVNENELFDALAAIPGVIARKVDYNSKIPFINQLEITHNTDIFIGMHGSGLTHLLFLPNWAVVFEIYNCEDENCYLDLARLRGVKYYTWKRNDKIRQVGDGKHPQMQTPHKKFADYYFDREEFLSLVAQQIEYVVHHPVFAKEQKRLKRNRAEEDL